MRVLRNIVALLITQLGTWSISLVLTLLVPSYLGPARYGLYSFVGSYVGFFALGMQLGTGTYLTWRIAREPELAPRLLFNTLLLQLPLALVCGIAAVLIVPALDPDPFVRELILILVVTNTLTALSATGIAALSGFQLMRVPAFINLFSVAVSAALLILSIRFHAGLEVFLLAGLAGQVVGLLALAAYTLRKIPFRPRADPRLWRSILVGGLPFFSWSLILLFYGQVSVSMLKILAGNTVVGWYAAANRIVGIPVFLPSIVIIAILPALSAEGTASSPRFLQLTSRSLRLVALITIPAAVGMIMLANNLTALLHFPSSFDQVGPIIAVLAANIPLIAVDMVLGTVLIALGRQKAWAAVGVVAAIVNPAANLWLIPYTAARFGNAAIGAACATLLTELVMLAGALILRPKTIFTRWDLWFIVRCLMAAALMVPAVLALASRTSIGTVAAVGYGIVVYAMAAYTLQAVRNDDLVGLFRLVVGRVGLGSSLKNVDAREAFDVVTTQTRAIEGGALTNPALSAVNGSTAARLAAISLPGGGRRGMSSSLRLAARPVAVRSGVADAGASDGAGRSGARSGAQVSERDDSWISIIFDDEE